MASPVAPAWSSDPSSAGPAAPPAPLVGDRNGRTVQVLATVLSNAVRYSPPGSPVGVTVASSEERAIVSVRDEGPGIPVEDQERLFVPFARTASAGGGGGSARVDGTGLGLYVSRALV